MLSDVQKGNNLRLTTQTPVKTLHATVGLNAFHK